MRFRVTVELLEAPPCEIPRPVPVDVLTGERVRPIDGWLAEGKQGLRALTFEVCTLSGFRLLVGNCPQ